MFDIIFFIPFIIIPIIFIIFFVGLISKIISVSRKNQKNTAEDLFDVAQENIFENIKNKLKNGNTDIKNNNICAYCGTVFDGHKCPNCGANKTE